VYFSKNNGLAEACLVFIEGNHLRQRLTHEQTLVVGELGFGTGLNILACWHTFAENALLHSPTRLHWWSVDEAWLDAEQRHQLLGLFPEIAPWVGTVVEQLESFLLKELPTKIPGKKVLLRQGILQLPGLEVELGIVQGDVLDFALVVESGISAWILDGHSPRLNPAMWSDKVFAMLAQRSIPGLTSVATYSAAGIVKQGLRNAGFRVWRRPGFGQKRHRLEGEYSFSPSWV
jgi:tRNA 5-methylaminomethyl-2-thiouridine biosynthesis bifunctional protein